MCRLLLILGEYDKKIIYDFLNQSIIKKNTPNINSCRDVDYHKDGFGFSWKYQNRYVIYKNEKCFLEDKNLENIINNIPKNILIGHIRAICPNLKSDVSYFNTHPFKYKENIWCHNGCITNFELFKKGYDNIILDKFKKYIKGNTDSEFLFFIFLSIFENKRNSKINMLVESVINLFMIFKKFKHSISANIIFCNNDYIFVSRYINKNKIAPSLYYNFDEKILISSEPLSKNYSIFPNNHCFIIDIKLKKIIIELKLSNI